MPVYGLGRDETGRPFYAMRLIQGESLKDRIRLFYQQSVEGGAAWREHAVEFRRMLGQFVDILSGDLIRSQSRGAASRHQAWKCHVGPVRRDTGRRRGLAKIIGKYEDSLNEERPLRPGSGSSFAETAMGGAVETPAFMSPEQAAGRLDELDGRTDVYGLGYMYMLLTGRPPFDRSSGDILRRVEEVSSFRQSGCNRGCRRCINL